MPLIEPLRHLEVSHLCAYSCRVVGVGLGEYLLIITFCAPACTAATNDGAKYCSSIRSGIWSQANTCVSNYCYELTM